MEAGSANAARDDRNIPAFHPHVAQHSFRKNLRVPSLTLGRRIKIQATTQPNTLMPIFVWIAIAIAVLLIGIGAGAGQTITALGAFFSGPAGYIVALAFIVAVVIALRRRSGK